MYISEDPRAELPHFIHVTHKLSSPENATVPKNVESSSVEISSKYMLLHGIPTVDNRSLTEPITWARG